MKTHKVSYEIIIMILIMASLAISGCKSEGRQNIPPNTLSKKEISEGWKLLFDGKTFDGWRGACKETFPEKGWVIEDGALTVLSEGNGGDIVTDSMYSNFDLRFEFKSPVNSNSGLKYYVLENTYEEGKALGLEYQTHDTGKRPLVDNDPHPNTLACLYDLLQATNRTVNPPGEWNSARIVSKGIQVEHWLNDIKVLEYERGGKVFRDAVAESKFRVYNNFGEALKGHFLLQDHNDKTSFRNIKIRELCE
jgi:hypothetical protein